MLRIAFKNWVRGFLFANRWEESVVRFRERRAYGKRIFIFDTEGRRYRFEV